MKPTQFREPTRAPNSTSTSTPVPVSDRVHHLTLPLVRTAQATVVLNADTKAVFRDGQLRIVWAGHEMIGATPLSGNWELDPQQAQEKGLCTVEYTSDDTPTKLAAIVTEMDDLIAFAADHALAKRMAERVRRMLVEVAGGEAAVAAAKT